MSSEDEQVAQRRANLEELAKLGVEVYPRRFERERTIGALVAEYGARTHDELEAERVSTVAAGRILAIRSFGKANFLVITDGRAKIQVYVRQDSMPELDFKIFKLLDFGDWVGVEGRLFRTKTNELTVWASRLHFLSKCLLPLPEKWHGLSDVETRYRQRYLDLIVNPDSRRVFETRSKVVSAIREFMTARGYLEVETPMMQPIAGGAIARPFVTHHNTLDMDLYLRIAPELYLKRLVVGGFEKVFEINRNFRNEGISTRHNPEFTMLEFYVAHRTYQYLTAFIEELIRDVAQNVLGTRKITYQGREMDLEKPFARMTIADALKKYHPEITDDALKSRDALIARLKALGIAYREQDGVGGLQLTLFENTVESQLFEPTYIYQYPAEVSPLARRDDANPEFTERFELYMAGREIANGFSELNDPEDQAARFQQQVKQMEAGDQEAMHYDADYVRALEYGLPPTAGAGIGIDRFVMLLTDSPSIRDVILFPLMRPE
jgi:lysyl-tRNA synthetase class 2